MAAEQRQDLPRVSRAAGVAGGEDSAVPLVGIQDHFQIQVNNGYGQEIAHLHYHFMSDRGMDKLNFAEE